MEARLNAVVKLLRAHMKQLCCAEGELLDEHLSSALTMCRLWCHESVLRPDLVYSDMAAQINHPPSITSIMTS